MSKIHIKFVLDDEVVMDGPLNMAEFSLEPPAVSRIQLGAAKRELWAMPAQAALVGAISAQVDTSIEVKTRDGGCSIDITTSKGRTRAPGRHVWP